MTFSPAFPPSLEAPPLLQRKGSASGAPAETISQKPIADRELELRQSAKEFESVFVAEMLRHAGLDSALSGDSGLGGEAFSSLLIDRYAEEIVEKGGFGFAEQIYRQLRKAPQ